MNIKVDSNTVIVFDLDDTLCSELDYLISAYKSIAEFLDQSNPKELFSKAFSLHRKGQDVFEYLSEEYNVSKEKLLKMYRSHSPELKLSTGALELLVSIKNKHGKLAILTDGREVTQRNKLKSLGIDDKFDCITISEVIGHNKPSKIGFELIEKTIKGHNYYYIGDNLNKDFIAPNELNWKTICLIDNGKNIHTQKSLTIREIQKPDDYVYSLEEINIV